MTGKKKKPRAQEQESRPAEPMQAKDPAEKQAIGLHSDVQDLSRRAGELEIQVGELDAELKSAREAARSADARAAELAAKAARAGDLEQELAALRKQLEQVQTWSAELSARAEGAAAAEKALREELAKTHEQHVTVIRAKDEKVAALESRAKEGMKRLKDAHDAALRDEAARATASEKEARAELKRFKELHEATLAEAAPLRSQVAELRVQVEKSGELRKDIEALSQQVGQAVGARDKTRRELDETRSLLNHTREELKKTQDLRDESERSTAALRMQVADLERKVREASKEDPRIATLTGDLRKAQDRIAEFERKAREVPKEDPRIATLTADLKKAQDRVAEFERKAREVPKEDPRIATLAADVKKGQERIASLAGELMRSQDRVTELEHKAREVPKEDPRIASLSGDLKKSQDRVAELERKAREIPKEDPRIATLTADLKKAQDRIAEFERKAREVPKEDPRIASLTGDLKKAQDRVAELERKARELPKDDARVAGLQRDLSAMKERAEKAEAKSAEAARYFGSMEQALVEAQSQADQVEPLKAELAKMKEECREHEEGLDQLAETVMELQHQLDSAAEAKPPPAPAPAPPKPPAAAAPPAPPKVEPKPAPARSPVAAAPPPPPPPPPPAPRVEPKSEPMKIEIDIDLDTPPSEAPPPLPKPVVLPAAVAVPARASNETTLRSNNAFGPVGDDGQPIYMLHEMLPKDVMGVMYRATERASGRAFAVRFMAGQAGEEQTRAFEKEVEKLTGLPHPNILHVQGSGRRKNRLYVMMDLVDAPTLGAAKIQEVSRICTILRDAAAAVHYAHEEEIFHGGLNLETILVAKEEDKDLALVKDFGLAYLLETQTAGLRNPAFLPPEQVRVLKSPLSAAVDVYGLGATLFAALTGRAPFEGKDAAQVVKRVMIEEPPPVEKLRPDVPKAVGAVVRRAMAKERGVRYASAGDLAEALNKALESR